MPLRSRVARAAATVFAAMLVLPGAVAAAPIDTPSEDRNQVMVITAVVAALALGLASVGFLFRRMKGMVHPPEDAGHASDHH